MSLKFRSIVLLAVLSCGTILAWGEDFKASVKQLATTEQYKNLLTAIAEATGKTVSLEVFPAQRSVAMVESGQVDIEIPNLLPKDSALIASLKYEASSAPLYDLAFVIYTNKQKPIDIESLKKGNPNGYKIETDGSILSLLGFKALPTTNIEGSMRKVDQGAIDGYIYSQLTADPVLKQLGLKTVKRDLYENFSLIFALPKGKKGGPADTMLVEGMKKLKANGKFDAIFGETVKAGKYNPWQP